MWRRLVLKMTRRRGMHRECTDFAFAAMLLFYIRGFFVGRSSTPEEYFPKFNFPPALQFDLYSQTSAFPPTL